MTYLYIQIALMNGESGLHATPEEFGTWVLLYAYCAQHENSGRIRNCRNWAPMTWALVTRGTTPKDHCPLWRWHGDDLVLVGYDLANQDLAQRKRAGGKLTQKRRREKALESSSPDSTPQSSLSNKVKESKERDVLNVRELGKLKSSGLPRKDEVLPVHP